MSPPLSGYRVLEVGSTVAGPFCGRRLADFGAEVMSPERIEALAAAGIIVCGHRRGESPLAG